jgi:hypothetical protein
VTITLADENDEQSKETRRRMLGWLARYDIADYLWKRAFKVVEGSSFSGAELDDPIEISRFFGKDDPLGEHSSGDPAELFLTMLHEESHWSPATEGQAFLETMDHFRATYPTLAKDAGMEQRPNVAYVHVPVNFYELQAGKRFLGPDRAYAILCRTPVYRKIYDVVIRDEDAIGKYLEDHKQLIEKYVPRGTPHRC